MKANKKCLFYLLIYLRRPFLQLTYTVRDGDIETLTRGLTEDEKTETLLRVLFGKRFGEQSSSHFTS